MKLQEVKAWLGQNVPSVSINFQLRLQSGLGARASQQDGVGLILLLFFGTLVSEKHRLTQAKVSSMRPVDVLPNN